MSSINKNRLLRRIEEIQKSPNLYTNSFLQNLENSLIQEYNLLLKMEEDYWKLKSHINWLSEGEFNTHFFHITTLNKKKKKQNSYSKK